MARITCDSLGKVIIWYKDNIFDFFTNSLFVCDSLSVDIFGL